MFPTQITFRNLRSSPDMGVRVRDLCEKLSHVNPRIVNCRVAIEQPAPVRRAAQVPPFVIEVRVRLPGIVDIVAPPQQSDDVDTALRKAFASVRRQLRESALGRPAVSS
jgi:ribosome-associated translation inhibitor RaiA